jgi:hypothetical protein
VRPHYLWRRHANGLEAAKRGASKGLTSWSCNAQLLLLKEAIAGLFEFQIELFILPPVLEAVDANVAEQALLVTAAR